MKNFLAASAVFHQPATRPFRIVVYAWSDHYVCHTQYVDTDDRTFEHGIYGPLNMVLANFAVRLNTNHQQTLECRGTVDTSGVMPYEATA